VARLKLSKSSLQQQRDQMRLYGRLLPSLDLKRRQLTVELAKAHDERQRLEREAADLDRRIGAELPMLAGDRVDLSGLVRLTGYEVVEENVVGVRLPLLERATFEVAEYPLLTRPVWADLLVVRLKAAAEARVRVRVAEQRVEILGQAVKRMTQRVNLFDKILIPQAKRNIQRIMIFLGDQERSAVSTAKLTKKLQLRNRQKPLATMEASA
jgi:V/A-type H+-transporting ATPase subunit D